MAEFVDVLRQFDRMCKANAGCFNCPLHDPDGVSDRCSIGAFINDSERIEREVMSWAAEHPEPVYPTIAKYLEQFGITIRRDGTLEADFFKANEPMSETLAKKLGLEPKEDT